MSWYSRQTVHDTVLTEYGNNELHPEVMPGTVLPTFYNMHTIYSRIARLNRPDVPTVDQIYIFNISLPSRRSIVISQENYSNITMVRDLH